MRFPLRRVVATLAAAAVLAGRIAGAADVAPGAHRLVRGEHFAYTLTLTFVIDERAIVDGPHATNSFTELDVVDVTPLGATLRERIRYDAAAGLAPQTHTLRTDNDGTWMYDDVDRAANNFATWDVAQLGALPTALEPGRRWDVDVSRTALWKTGHAVVRVVSVDRGTVTVHVDGTTAGGGAWQTDVTYADGILRDLHRIDTTPPGNDGNAAGTRLDYRVRLVQHRL